jgi:hypothetical protein
MYEPRSKVTHVRGTPGAELLQLARHNHAIFEQRWRRVLASRPVSAPTVGPRGGAAVDAEPSQ